jgi:filamentous hemagglutinin family protein
MGFLNKWGVSHLAIAGVAFLQTGMTVAAGIVASGGTVTTVTTAPGGRQTVNIAPAVSGVSHNTYTEFNVGTAGAALNNVGVNARNIVNQVTGTNPSLIQGDITVLGPRANVILANPNGVTFNGGSFVNTGNVAITTGQVSFNDITLAPGIIQRNIVLDTSQGQITIGAGGLSGALLDLALIAKNVSVNGAVLNTVSNSAAKIEVVGGDSHSEIDGSVSPTDLTSTWIGHTAAGIAAPGAIAVDITPLGSLTAGKISIIVTQQGAGVMQAGSAFASVGDFDIAGNGDLNVSGGRIEAVGNVVLANASVTSAKTNVNGADALPSIKAGNTIQITAGSVALSDTALSAGQRTIDGSGNSVVSQIGHITIGTDGVAGNAAVSITHSSMDATGGIGLYNDGQQLAINASQLSAEQNIFVKAQDITLASSFAPTTAGRTSLSSKTGAIAMTATGTLQSTGALLNGAVALNLNANRILAAALHDAVSANIYKSSFQSSSGDVTLTTSGITNLSGTDVVAANNVLAQNAGFSLQSDGGTSANIVATAGGVLIDGTGNIDNIGGLIQGATRITSNTASLGAVTLNTTGGNINNSSPSESSLGAVFGVNDDVVLHASGDVINRNARVISNEALAIVAGGDVRNIIDTQGGNGGQAVSYQTSSNRWLFFSERSSGFDVDYGHVAMPNQLAYLVAETGMTIQAANIINTGGNIVVNNGNLSVNAGGAFHNEAALDGQAHYQSKCLLVCNVTVSSNVTTYGGAINTGGDIAITAGTEATNLGGSVLALGNLTVAAPKIYASGVTGYRAYTQDGIKTWFGNSWGRLYATDIGGSWLAANTLTLLGQGVIDGGSFEGLIQMVAASGIVTLRSPSSAGVSIERNLGLTSSLW